MQSIQCNKRASSSASSLRSCFVRSKINLWPDIGTSPSDYVSSLFPIAKTYNYFSVSQCLWSAKSFFLASIYGDAFSASSSIELSLLASHVVNKSWIVHTGSVPIEPKAKTSSQVATSAHVAVNSVL